VKTGANSLPQEAWPTLSVSVFLKLLLRDHSKMHPSFCYKEKKT